MPTRPAPVADAAVPCERGSQRSGSASDSGELLCSALRSVSLDLRRRGGEAARCARPPLCDVEESTEGPLLTPSGATGDDFDSMRGALLRVALISRQGDQTVTTPPTRAAHKKEQRSGGQRGTHTALQGRPRAPE